ncbi:hypothetical protein DMN91_004238 [Ooceraea biroi]|uniref:Uncharacterized protein n=1 Tax=Ooceraea biroi TaxID=2015173 RepID=A0A3L8DVQ7_OOCBI|nr:putative uncharacterized protein DDB_G0292292 [Ooceraea biroi]RLU24029.1 hypothetical protein DMN91_004238 [Ooceraea biroi]
MSKTKNSIRSNKEHDNLSSCTSSSLSSDEEEIDARDLKPIKDYLSNRKELACQLFKSVKPEKIRMMLPQVLKQMDLNELEEWCASELNGMSKARIISILNGKPMLESSDTSESDDSGPSLEIISDTEEWTDDDVSKKENGKGKVKRDKTKTKRKAQINKKNNSDKSNIKAKCNIKTEVNDKNKDIKIKKEDDKDKGKEGDSLLDLLELEMRARAIRALIRKEEDIIPSSNPSQSNGQTVENNIATSQDDAKAKENCRKQLEKIISAQQSTKGDDEDVVLVVQPTPVVELLSSDSDKEDLDGARINKQLENLRATAETEKAANNSDENAANSNATVVQDSKEKKGAPEATGKRNDSKTGTKIDLSEARTIMPERNIGIRNNTLSISISADNVAERRKKSKKRSQKQNAKVQVTTSAAEDSPRLKEIDIAEASEQSSDVKNKDIKEQSKPSPSDENKVAAEEENTCEKVAKESRIEEDRLADMDEIIDLDDYCDVMDIVSGDDERSQDKFIVLPQEENKQPALQTTVDSTESKADSAETWASRYYQTDDVQNVIKESKIQSEIRKRLRERQRLSKLSKSPNLNLPSQSALVDGTSAASEKIPTGSVEEYLALKRVGTANINNNTNDNNNTTPNNSDNNDTIQDNSATVNFSNDINAKESSVQDENISSIQEYTDNISDVQKTAVSESTVTQLPEEVITETKNDAQLV